MHDTIEWRFVKGTTTDEMILSVEKVLGIKFPVDYVECIKKYSQGSPKPNFFSTEQKTTVFGKGGTFEYFLTFDPQSTSYILDYYHAINHRSGGDNKVPDGIIPFASANYNQDDLCFDFRKCFPPRVVLLDLQKHWEYLDRQTDKASGKEIKEEDYLIHVCNSFTELLDMLENKPEN